MTVEEYNKLIVRNIEHRLSELGLTRKEFAKMMGVSTREIDKWLSGSHNFYLARLYEIGRKLAMPKDKTQLK